jgi:hypothetical protein
VIINVLAVAALARHHDGHAAATERRDNASRAAMAHDDVGVADRAVKIRRREKLDHLASRGIEYPHARNLQQEVVANRAARSQIRDCVYETREAGEVSDRHEDHASGPP